MSFDGQEEGRTEAGPDYVRVRCPGGWLIARGADLDRVSVGAEELASRQAVYRVARLERAGNRLTATVELGPDPPP